MRIVVDCNVLVSADLTDGLSRRTLLQIIELHEPVTSPTVRKEYSSVIMRPKFKRNQLALTKFRLSLEEISIDIDPPRSPYRLPDESDECYLDVAIAAEADLIVTGNLRHFPARRYGFVFVVSPSQFLSL